MNREAAALGVPVYSIFKGRLGAVDQHLAKTGRLTLIQEIEDIRTKIALEHRMLAQWDQAKQSAVLDSILGEIISIAEEQCLSQRR